MKNEEERKEEDTKILTEEEFLEINGYPFMGYSEPALHHHQPQASGKQVKKTAKLTLKTAQKYDKMREKLRKKYREKIAKGEIRKPRKIEELRRKAQGHPDNESVQAARRILRKRGIKF